MKCIICNKPISSLETLLGKLGVLIQFDKPLHWECFLKMAKEGKVRVGKG